MDEAKRIFISYAWGSKEHQDWVAKLGARLMDDTIDVILDQWSLELGHDVPNFMEKTVKDENVSKVLIICDKNYTEKADERKGGVGTETQIITPKIYGQVEQTKFIPILLERNDKGQPYLPVFLSSLKYVDFSKEEFYEESYEELLRHILNKPARPKPKLGTKVPLYISETKVNDSKLNSIFRTLENQLKKYPEQINTYAADFIDEFLETLWEFKLETKSSNYIDLGKDLIDNLKSFKTVREDFIDFLLVVTKPIYNLDVDELIQFFEKAKKYQKPRNNISGVQYYTHHENFDIIFHELFIYTISSCIKNKNFRLLGDILHSKYYFDDEYFRTQEPVRYTELYKYSEYIENYYRLIKDNKISPLGDFMIGNLSERVKRDDFVLADTLAHYIGDIFKDENDYRDRWFPHTHLYNQKRGNFEFLKRLSSKRFFEKIKDIFNVSKKEDLVDILIKYRNSKKGKDRPRYSSGAFESIPFIFEIIEPEKIATNR